MIRRGLIRSYNNSIGEGTLFSFDEEQTLSFCDDGGSGFKVDGRVTFAQFAPSSDSWRDQGTVNNVQAEE